MSIHRRAARRDGNETEIIAALESQGWTVTPLSAPGVPDLLIGARGINVLIEVKDPDGSSRGKPTTAKLTDAQQRWHDGWKGQAEVATSTLSAIAIVKRHLRANLRAATTRTGSASTLQREILGPTR